MLRALYRTARRLGPRTQWVVPQTAARPVLPTQNLRMKRKITVLDKPQQNAKPFPFSYFQKQREEAKRPIYQREWFKVAAPLCMAFGAYYFAKLETVPYSGRRRALLLPSRIERFIAAFLDELLLKQYANAMLPNNSEAVVTVKRIGDRLTASNGLPPLEYFVVDDANMNAFVSGGGKVFVNTGLFQVLSNEDQLAVVMSHEIAHYLAHHMSESVLLKGVLWLVAVVLDPDSWSIPAVMNLLVELPYSRKRELEADFIGLLLLANSCFDINEPRNVWRQLGAAEGLTESGLESESVAERAIAKYSSTHPSHNEREENFRDDGPWMAEARKAYHQHCVQMKEFMEVQSNPIRSFIDRHLRRIH
eukprot:comp19804_c0_seq1/m.23785 comp19804_c0_seq1/g.23785  ORF comp19804_c0_seq1/g.23785 comp19804_c0_seq1/m.23785 type:complete len:362 (-) comp19804_c0_seq1:311-1396(-)